MKYLVTVGERTLEVIVDGHRVTVDGREHHASLVPVPGTPLRQLLVGDRSLTLPVVPGGRGAWELSLAGDRWEVEVLDERTRHIRSLTAERQGRSGVAALKAPMPGLVVRLLVEPGQPVAAGTGLVVLEAMKMENELKATAPALVRAVLVQPGAPVEKGQVLVEFESPPT